MDLLVRHYMALCQAYDVPSAAFRDDWGIVIERFLRDATRHRELTCHVAELDGQVAGSLMTQAQILPYPDVLKSSYRKHGYLLGAYVLPELRGHGIATELLRVSLAHLKQIGCTKCVLHAADRARSLYERAGFEPSNEMRLNL